MNIEQLQLVNRNETSDILLKLFSTMEQKSDETNLTSFFTHLVNKGNKIVKNQYDSFFKELEQLDIGFIAPNGIFKWKYSFKDVSEQILLPNKLVNIRPINNQVHDLVINVTQTKEKQMSPKKRGRGRPKGSRNKNNVTIETPARPVERPTIAPQTSQNGSGREVIFLFTTSKGKTLPFNLEDAERLLKQVQNVKEHLG